MATLVLSAAGMAIGGSVGGTVLGLSMATIGRAAGATIGRMIDQRLLGAGSDAVETGRVDRFRLTGASEGAALAQVYGRMRVGGQIIWATRFKEYQAKSGGGGKGAGPQPTTIEYSYSVSMAIALCEGEITHVGRIWADGIEISTSDLNMRLYRGTQTQAPDPKIVAVEGSNNVPAYRGTAYVVLEDLDLARFGNRVPQLTFEVMHPSEPGTPNARADMARTVRGVALIPGTGEYSLATSAVHLSPEYGEQVSINTNSPSGVTDFSSSLDSLEGELPNCKSSMLVVSWFGSDLRCGDCDVTPKVEQTETDGDVMPWVVSGQARATAGIVPMLDERPVYGGTPTDSAVIEAIVDMRDRGIDPVFYPFILMEQMPDNALIDPWTGVSGQPKLPWRGRITSSLAPLVAGSPDGTTVAEAEVDAFMGTAAVGDFAIVDGAVTYSGPSQWRYRRFILHYAYLCLAAGGVSAFCIGSEMRGLTQIRGAGGSLTRCGFWPQRCAVFWALTAKSAMLPIGRNTMGISPRTQPISCFILIRFGLIQISISSVSTITCRSAIGVTGSTMPILVRVRSITSHIFGAILPVAKATTGITIHPRLATPRSALQLLTVTMNLGSGATRILKAGGDNSIIIGSTGCVHNNRQAGYLKANRFGLPN